MRPRACTGRDRALTGDGTTPVDREGPVTWRRWVEPGDDPAQAPWATFGQDFTAEDAEEAEGSRSGDGMRARASPQHHVGAAAKKGSQPGSISACPPHSPRPPRSSLRRGPNQPDSLKRGLGRRPYGSLKRRRPLSRPDPIRRGVEKRVSARKGRTDRSREDVRSATPDSIRRGVGRASVGPEGRTERSSYSRRSWSRRSMATVSRSSVS